MPNPEAPEIPYTTDSLPKVETIEFKKRWDVDWLRTVGASVMLSILLTAGANLAKPDKDIRLMNPQPNYKANEARMDVGFYDVSPIGGEIELPGIKFSEVKQGQTELYTDKETLSQESSIQLMEWARLFDADPEAVEPRGPDMIKGAAEQIKQLEADGFSVDQITIKGYASDESDTHVGDNPGFGISDEKNVKLANKRANAVMELYKEQLEQTLAIDDAKSIESKIVVAGGEEIQDSDQAAAIDAMADKLGMSTIDLVWQFDSDPSSLPTEAQSVLEGLRQDRFVKIEVEASKMNYHTERTDKEKSLIIIFIPVPIFKRKTTITAWDGTSPPTPPPVPSEPSRPLVPNPRPGQYFQSVKNIGHAQPGFGQVNNRVIQPSTSNMHYGKGSGIRVGMQRQTTHRGNTR